MKTPLRILWTERDGMVTGYACFGGLILRLLLQNSILYAVPCLTVNDTPAYGAVVWSCRVASAQDRQITDLLSLCLYFYEVKAA